MPSEEVLERINAKLGALLALQVDQYLRDTKIARPKSRSIDKMLADAGLTPPEIASLLGKTTRAVYLALEDEQNKAQRKGTRRRSSQAPADAEGG